jgi:hypothetical protein
MNTNRRLCQGDVSSDRPLPPVHVADCVAVDETAEEVAFHRRWQPTLPACEKDVDESVRLGNHIRAVPMQCWFNARRAVLKLTHYADAAYVEGWALPEGMAPLEHAWLVKKGAVVDPTLPARRVTYFPGLEFRARAGIEEFLRTPQGKECKRSPFFHAFGWGGMESPSFRRCFEDAQRAFADWNGIVSSGETVTDATVA